jgi:hypothetical protein
MMRSPTRSSSLLAVGTIAAAALRACSTVGLSPAMSAASRNGTSPDTVASGAAPMSTCPERTRRRTSGPATLRSDQAARLTLIFAFFGSSSRSSGTSTLVYWGMVAIGWLTIVTVIGRTPHGRSAAASRRGWSSFLSR